MPYNDRLSPNDLLAVEYLRALSHFHADAITPHTLQRLGAGHHDDTPTDRYASASYLRDALIQSTRPVTVAPYLPPLALAALREYAQAARLLSLADFSDLIYYALLREREDGYAGYFDVYDDLSHKICASLESYSDIYAFLLELKSRDIAYSHLSRAMLHILLGIRATNVQTLTIDYGYCPWLRPLGFRRSAADLLSAIKAHADRPFLAKLADAPSLLDAEALSLLRRDLAASQLHHKLAAKKGGIPTEYRRPLILL